MRKAANIYWLGKELRSFLHDFVLLGLVVYAFSLAVIVQAPSNSQELHNASIAIVDEDNSELSRRIAHAFMPRIAFNPNITTAWFSSVMGIINNVTMLAIILAGAAIIREREHGTDRKSTRL